MAKKMEPKHALSRKAIRVKMERSYRGASDLFGRAVKSAKAKKCFEAANWESHASLRMGMGEAYAVSGRFPLEGSSSQNKAAETMWDARDAMKTYCKVNGPLAGMKRRKARR